jgi:tetratricopeptide (TPR) repeat protein
MTRYVEIAERNDDMDAQIRGHFYNALAYERHGEPCMAAADIEIGRDIAKDIGSPLSLARLTSFLAHLWIRRGEIKEAIALENEALRSVRPFSQGLDNLCGGMVMLVNAEVQAGMGDWKESARTFQQSRDALLHDPPEPVYFEALAHSWYGEILLLYKRSDEACYHLEVARSLFEGLGNGSQTARALKTMNEGTCPVCPAWPL